MVGVLADDGSLRHQQDTAVSRVFETLPHPVAPALFGLGRAGMPAFRLPFSRIFGGDAVGASAFDGRDTART